MPSTTKKDIREYSHFIKLLKKNGFLRMQESVFTKLALNPSIVNSTMLELKKNLPPEGTVSVLTLTETQFMSIENLIGEMKTDVVMSCGKVMKFLLMKLLEIKDDLSNIDSYLLVIKNRKILYKLLSNADLQYEDSYIQILDENYKELKVSDYIDFVTSVINLDANSKKNLNVLLRRIKKEENEVLIKTSNEINKKLEECAKQIKLSSPINIFCDIDLDEDDVIKMLGISLQDDSPNLVERINNYINVSFELRNIKIFIFYNLLAFLDESELDLLVRANKYNGIKIIDIENVEYKTNIFDHIKILDEDICVI